MHFLFSLPLSFFLHHLPKPPPTCTTVVGASINPLLTPKQSSPHHFFILWFRFPEKMTKTFENLNKNLKLKTLICNRLLLDHLELGTCYSPQPSLHSHRLDLTADAPSP
ncbi:hypothetical protein ES332_D07G156900v1 [Gossypium tomentosum]|uniref:Uncharacterized protein n=1 Tax=Gossypium tomentosum TaxID=34277 RepID=A0A5D2K776_GOSTO|nr:hypothetical protein ES332_D07G156900v1 [Gossypium tomentosum]